MVNEKRYGRWSRPEASYSEDLYSADDESMIESRPESRMSDAHITSEPDHVESSAREVRTYLYSYQLHKLVQSLLLRENSKSVGRMFTGK